MVKESVSEVIEKILEYKKRILVFPLGSLGSLGSSPDQFKRLE
ncbi:hypothetical protein LEP1GSC088_2114 [Leptospira interrogans str. L1207]|nr:hypothetical protein LEP1GSC088_2114 [Leptospira interrogans str. L1207]